MTAAHCLTSISPVTREFTSPSGRRWTAYLLELPPLLVRPGERANVLRFESGDIALDLREWPDGWESLPEATLVELVRQANAPNYQPREPQQ